MLVLMVGGPKVTHVVASVAHVTYLSSKGSGYIKGLARVVPFVRCMLRCM